MCPESSNRSTVTLYSVRRRQPGLMAMQLWYVRLQINWPCLVTIAVTKVVMTCRHS